MRLYKPRVDLAFDESTFDIIIKPKTWGRMKIFKTSRTKAVTLIGFCKAFDIDSEDVVGHYNCCLENSGNFRLLYASRKVVRREARARITVCLPRKERQLWQRLLPENGDSWSAFVRSAVNESIRDQYPVMWQEYMHGDAA